MPKTDLSLGKLRRATDPANVSSDTTANSKLRADAAGVSSGNNFKISEFAIDEVSSSLSGSRFMDEGTSETYKLEFKSVGSRFLSRIARHKENFFWEAASGLSVSSANNYTGSVTAAAISNTITVVAGGQDSMSAAHAGDTRISMSGAYVDDNVAGGFNASATNYNKKILHLTQVEDTYNGTAITCFTPDTKLTLVDGTQKEIQDLAIGDELLSMRMPNAQTEEEHPVIASDVAYSDYCIVELGESELVSAKIINMFFDFADTYFLINGEIKVTGEHPFFVKVPEGFYLPTKGQSSEEFWAWEYVRNLEIGQVMYDKDMNEVPIDSIEEIEEEIEIVNIDVDTNNTYFAEGILVHNKGSETSPVDNDAHNSLTHAIENPGTGSDAV
jgi:hypothetical protein|tara:strand:+ start:2416 stop:3573 length:1158 start_codon:yes stop_codon:yes gene_type:complete